MWRMALGSTQPWLLVQSSLPNIGFPKGSFEALSRCFDAVQKKSVEIGLVLLGVATVEGNCRVYTTTTALSLWLPCIRLLLVGPESQPPFCPFVVGRLRWIKKVLHWLGRAYQGATRTTTNSFSGVLHSTLTSCGIHQRDVSMTASGFFTLPEFSHPHLWRDWDVWRVHMFTNVGFSEGFWMLADDGRWPATLFVVLGLQWIVSATVLVSVSAEVADTFNSSIG